MLLSQLIKKWLTAAVITFQGTAYAQQDLCTGTGSLAPPQNTLNQVRTSFTTVPGHPFGLVFSKQYHNVAFATLTGSNSSALAVLNTSIYPPSLLHEVQLPGAASLGGSAAGLVLTNAERHLLITAGRGAYIVDVARALAGRQDALVGSLDGSANGQTPGTGAIEITLSKDGCFAFISQEYGSKEVGNIDVFQLEHARNGSLEGSPIGFVTLNELVVGSVLSPDGRTLYATSEQIAPNIHKGSLSVLDVKTLESDPSKALRYSVPAGCGTVRVIVSVDGKVVWVTNRQENTLQAFDTSKLATKRHDALLANITVGTSPVGLTFVKGETRILTADSNRFSVPGATSGITVVDVQAALAGKGQDSVLGKINAGLFPREFAVSPNGEHVLVADNGSDQIQSIDVSSLP